MASNGHPLNHDNLVFIPAFNVLSNLVFIPAFNVLSNVLSIVLFASSPALATHHTMSDSESSVGGPAHKHKYQIADNLVFIPAFNVVIWYSFLPSMCFPTSCP